MMYVTFLLRLTGHGSRIWRGASEDEREERLEDVPWYGSPSGLASLDERGAWSFGEREGRGWARWTYLEEQ